MMFLGFQSKTKLSKAKVGRPFQVAALLFAGCLFSAQPVFSAPAEEAKVQAFSCSAEETAPGDLFGHWAFFKETLHPYPDIGLGPFPEYIIIEKDRDGKAVLTVKLRAQSRPKVYLFSFDEPVSFKSVQTYDKPDITFENKVYTLIEETRISFQKEGLTVDLSWTRSMPGETDKTVTGSYLFCRYGDDLAFTRTNRDPTAEEPLSVFRAFYIKKSPAKES